MLTSAPKVLSILSFRRWFAALLVGAALIGPRDLQAQSPVISEFMAAGQYAVADEDGDYPDWLEIHNPSPTPLALAGWHLTDRVDRPAKWTLPAVTVPGNGYLLVFASGKNRAVAAAQLHASFAIDADGGYLALVRPDGSIAFKFDPYPLQLPDVAYDHNGRFLGYPTPGAANDPREVVMAAAPHFSEPHGFKREAFKLALTTPTEGAQMRYTLDGSEPSETVGIVYSAPIGIKKTSVVRAVAIAEGAKTSAIVTRTYLFVPDIVAQSADGKAPPGWPRKWPNHKTDYGMDPRITATSPYNQQLREGLKAIPSISLVMPLQHLFSEETGIYTHPQERGKEWERPTSIELIHPDGTPGFHVNGGLRIRGGASRDLSNPKHALRLFFRRDYGAPKLEYPMFGSDGSPVSDKFDLRCDQISSWHWAGDANDDFIRDQWGRDTQIAMGQPSGRGDFFHLYINGLYWGLYNTQERHDAAFAAQYFGGNEDDYDVVKYDNSVGGTNETDGTIASWRRLHDAAYAGFETAEKYQRVQGNNPDGSRNGAYERLVDVDNLIDYMLLGVYSAASDNPPSGGVQNNWGAIKSRKGDFGYRFFVHDWELSMFDAQNDNVVGEPPVENPLEGIEYTWSNMWHVWQAMRFNADFRQRVADRVQKHFFHGGALTPEKAAARFKARMDEINLAVVGESARWGDSFFTNNDGGGGPFLTINPRNHKPAAGSELKIRPGGPGVNGGKGPLTRQDWLNATRVAYLQNYFPVRTGVVLQQLKDGGLYPALDAPSIEPGSGNIAPGQAITLTNPNSSGTIYFTLDGSDPRALGGAVAAGATLYSTPVLLGPLKMLKARVKDGDTWSALAEARYENAQDFSGLHITEIGYHFRNTPFPGDDYDFIELKNAGATPLDLSGLLFDEGITYLFPTGTVLAPGAFYVIARNAVRFSEAHPGTTPDGLFTGRLSDLGEDLTLSAGSGIPLISLHFRPDDGWPALANGVGFTLVRADGGNPNNPKNWRASTHPGGSPRADDPPAPIVPRVAVNELLPRPTSGPSLIELANPGALPVDLSGWWLSNDPTNPLLFPVPAGTVIPPHGYVTLPFPASETGGHAYLFSATSNGDLTGYSHGFVYEITDPDVSVGRIVNSDADEKFVAQSAVTLGEENAGPRASAIVLNEINYAPVAGGDEFIELRNRSGTAVAIGGWKLDGFGFTFPTGAELAAGALAVVTAIDPTQFRTKYSVPAEVSIYGAASGNLQNDGENIALQRPVTLPGVPGAFFQSLESVRYNDADPWPWAASGFGASLQRPIHAPFCDDPGSWLGAEPTPGRPNVVNAPPGVSLTSPLPNAGITPPNPVMLAADAIDPDGSVVKVEFLSDSGVVGEANTAPFTLAWTGAEPGQHDITARAIDDSGNVTESASVTIFVQDPQPGTGLGLFAEYFANAELTVPVAATRHDATIDFQWTDLDPAAGVSRTGFSVRWTGQFVPRATGDTQLTINAAGGVRLYLDDELLIDGWENEAPQDFYANFAAVAGFPNSLRVEYRDTDGFAGVRLSYTEPNRFEQKVVPTDLLYLPTQDPSAFAISTPANLPVAQVGTPYQLQFRTAHGVSPVFQVASAVNVPEPEFSWGIPPGMAFTSAGLLSGTPTQPGDYGIAIYATSANGDTTPQAAVYRITVLPGGAITRPVVKITAPKPGAKFVGNTVLLAGGVTSERGIQRVEYSLNSSAWRPMTLAAPPMQTLGATDDGPTAAQFAATLDNLRGLFAGQNTLLMRAIDSVGITSLIVTRRFSLRQFSNLTVLVDGAGTVSPAFLGTTRREVGQTYTIVARPGHGQIFKWWVEGEFISNTNRTLTFTMPPNLVLTAVFIPTPYRQIAGRYLAAVGTDQERSDARGRIDVQLSHDGTFTGKLRFGGKGYALKGKFDSTGYFFTELEGGTIVIDGAPAHGRKRGLFESLNLSLQLDFENRTITAYLNRFTDTDFLSLESLLQRTAWNPYAGRPCPLAGRWNVNISGLPIPKPNGAGVLPGEPTPSAPVRLDIDPFGRATITGTLADGTPWITRSRVDDTLSMPLYSPLYDKLGSLSGALRFTLDPTARGTGDFFWERPADAANGEFPDGFAIHVILEATPFVAP